MADIAVRGLPAGVVELGLNLKGTPTASGVSTVTVTATDDRGAKVSTQFKITVVDLTSSANQPPLVSKAIADQKATVGQAFSFDIPKSTFTDADGSIASIAATGLPAGIVQTGERISGKPTTAGSYTVTVTATDNEGARVATQFKITVDKAQVPPANPGNQPPVVTKAIADQRTTVGQNFAFDIPKSTFSDPDGSITGITVAGLPEGVMVAGWLLLGTPTVAGTYLVTITATDNQGAKVQTELVLIVNKTKADTVPLTVASTIADQQARVGELFRFVVPAATFAGPVADIAVRGLPAGIVQSGLKLGGTPTASGVSTVTVTATDDRGAKVSTQFKITVVDLTASANQPPLVSKAIADQKATVGQAFSFDIPKSTFTDADGSIASIAATGLPAGIVQTGERISGKPTTAGSYTVTVTATDNEGARVATQFKITVDKAQVPPANPGNQPPVVTKAIADQRTTVGQNFAFDIPKSTFSDPDGSITGITVAGLPEGVMVAGWLLLGTPTVAGTYLVTITATDNQGAKVQTELVLIVNKTKADTVPLAVASTIADQQARVGELFRFVVPAATFAGPVADIAVRGLPAGIVRLGPEAGGHAHGQRREHRDGDGHRRQRGQGVHPVQDHGRRSYLFGQPAAPGQQGHRRPEGHGRTGLFLRHPRVDLHGCRRQHRQHRRDGPARRNRPDG